MPWLILHDPHEPSDRKVSSAQRVADDWRFAVPVCGVARPLGVDSPRAHARGVPADLPRPQGALR